MTTSHTHPSASLSRVMRRLAGGIYFACVAFPLAAFADPDFSNLDNPAVVKKPVVGITRGLTFKPAGTPRTSATRTYNVTRGVVTIEEVDGTVKELPYVVLPILFKYDSDELLDAQSRENVSKAAAKLQEPNLRGARFIVEGHTSTEGAADHNQALSDRRAKRVLNLLVTQFGIEPSRLQAQGFGRNAPEVKPELNDEDRQRNRRVLVVKESNGP